MARDRNATPDPYRDILGLDLSPERLDHDLTAFADILAELKKLRRLDLTDVHPAVVFDPTGGHRGNGPKR